MRIDHRPTTTFVPKQETKTYYITEDGKEFLDQARAEEYEEKLRKKKLIPSKYFELEGPDEGVFFYLKGMEDLEVLGYAEEVEENENLKDKLVFPNWYLIRTIWPDLSDLNKPLVEIYTKEEIKSILEEALNSIPE